MLVFNAMKKYIVRIIQFFAIVALVDFVVGWAGDYLQTHAKGGGTKAINDLVKKDQHDILILGSSRARHHYDTPFLSDTLNLDVYNAGYDGNGVILAYGILQMVLERYEPKLVVFDVEPSFDIYEYAADNNHIRYLNNLKPYYNRSGIPEIFKDVSTEEWYKVQSGMIRNNTEIISRVVDNTINRGRTPCGYSPLKGVMTEESVSDHKDSGELDSFKLKYIQKLITLCKENNIPLIMVASPKYGAENSIALNPAMDLAKQNNVVFLDYYAAPLFMSHMEWFNEPMHLNGVGAKNFSIYISDFIKKKYNYLIQ